MKNNLIIIIFLTVFNLNAQEKSKKKLFGMFPFYDVSIVLRDSTKINGLGRKNFNNEIAFKTDEKAETIIYNHKQLKAVSMNIEDKTFVYEYKIENNSTNVKLLELLIKGKINLYSETKCGSPQFCTIKYYISKGNEDSVENLGIARTRSNSFQEIAAKYLADCPDLIEKIKAKYFRKYGVNDVVNYYNNLCTK